MYIGVAFSVLAVDATFIKSFCNEQNKLFLSAAIGDYIVWNFLFK